MSWSPEQYTRFEAERTRPVRDLAARLPVHGVQTVVDLGCGPGNSTEVLAERFPGADVCGLDSSPEMVATAQRRLPALRFEEADITAWAHGPRAPGPRAPGPRAPSPRAPGPDALAPDALAPDALAPDALVADARADVVFANAALQWVPDHAALLPALLNRVAPGGCLAVQVPDNLDEPTHRLMREVAEAGPWAARLTGAAEARGPRHDPGWYHRVLEEAGAAVDIWRTTYFHRLAGAAGIVEWFMSTGLRPFVQPLGEAERAEYLRRYREALSEAYPALPDGSVLLPFPRLFFVATRSSTEGRASSNRSSARQ